MFELEAQSSTTEQHASSLMHNMVIDGSNGSRIMAVDDGNSPDADISQFLSRKVKIHTAIWGVGTSFAATLKPWNLFLSNPAVLNKMQNYYLIKGSLKLTFYVNGTPFHAGMLLASYRYLNGGKEVVTIGGDTQIVTRSQRPHILLNVSTCKSGCICVPFFLPQNYMSLTDAIISSTDIGTLNIDSFADLIQINSGTDSVTITVFAELTDVKLTAPTTNAVALSSHCTFDSSIFALEAQAGDEYTSEGVISGPASTVATVAGMLTSAPVIGPLAVATQMGANAVAGFARFFGYSKPITLEDIKPMRNMPVGNLALTEGSDMSQKLTVTGKQEISIDPSTVNLPPVDELSLYYLTSKESYLTQFDWDVTDIVDTTLFSCDVDPMAERRDSTTGGTRIIPTSLSFASRPFEAWSGTLHYRFQVIASQYHRGRISIIYDPTGPLTGDPYNTTFNTIIDLADGRDFTVSFNWQQDSGYLLCDMDNSRTFYTQTTPATSIASRSHSNGVFFVNVVNELVVPDATSGVKIIVSVSAGDDYELVNPSGNGMEVTNYQPVAQSLDVPFDVSMFELEAQSAVEETPSEENAPEAEMNQMTLTTGVQINQVQKPLIFYGEKILSVRQMLKRYCHHRSYISAVVNGASFNNDLAHFLFLMKQMPSSPGFDPNGFDRTTGFLTPYNYVSNTYINYFKGAYAGWKGSIRWKFLPSTSTTANMTVTRLEDEINRAAQSDGRATAAYSYAPLDSYGGYAANGVGRMRGSTAGGAVTQNRTMDSLEVEIPYALPIRFSNVQGEYMPTATNTLSNSYPGGSAYQLDVSTTKAGAVVAFETYVSAGEDFTLFGFVGAPVIYYAATPLPN